MFHFVYEMDANRVMKKYFYRVPIYIYMLKIAEKA